MGDVLIIATIILLIAVWTVIGVRERTLLEDGDVDREELAARYARIGVLGFWLSSVCIVTGLIAYGAGARFPDWVALTPFSLTTVTAILAFRRVEHLRQD